MDSLKKKIFPNPLFCPDLYTAKFINFIGCHLSIMTTALRVRVYIFPNKYNMVNQFKISLPSTTSRRQESQYREMRMDMDMELM